MTTRKILTYPDERLRTKCIDVTEFNRELAEAAQDMLETMYREGGIGLAAPQVGLGIRLAVVDVSDQGNQPITLVNPEIVRKEGTVRSEEGCLSIPGFRDVVSRASLVTVRAQSTSGELFEVEAEDLLSRCLQHEIDHLDGVCFVEHLSRIKKEMFKRWLKRQEAEEAA